MSSLNQSPRQEAAAWHARLSADDASERDWLAFEHWLASAPNKAAYEALESTLVAMADDRVAVLAALKPSMAAVAPRAPTMLWASAAAGMAAVLIGVVLLTSPKPQDAAYAAPASAMRTVTLADQSVLQLNRGASVHVRFDAQSRHVVLERGEASFAVRHDRARPFSVATGQVSIRDIGTEFDVVRAEGYVTVTVREGQVAMTPVDGRPVTLGAGQQGRVEGGKGAVAVSVTNPNDAFAWQSGRLIYRDAPLARIVEDISRYSQKPVVIADRRAATLHFTGVLEIDEPALMVHRLEAFLPIRSAQDADRIEVRIRQ